MSGYAAGVGTGKNGIRWGGVMEDKGITRICDNCNFYKTINIKGNIGECRKNPPKGGGYDENGGIYAGQFPLVEEEWWCGEFLEYAWGEFDDE